MSFAVEFNVNNATHLSFVVATANLKAEVYGVKRDLSPDQVRAVAQKIQLPAFEPKQGIKIATTEAEQQQHAEHPAGLEGSRIDEIVKSLPTAASLKGERSCHCSFAFLSQCFRGTCDCQGKVDAFCL